VLRERVAFREPDEMDVLDGERLGARFKSAVDAHSKHSLAA
jgi:hypothetical protein